MDWEVPVEELVQQFIDGYYGRLRQYPRNLNEYYYDESAFTFCDENFVVESFIGADVTLCVLIFPNTIGNIEKD